MKRFSMTVFDDFIMKPTASTTTAYTASVFDELLAACDQLAIQVIADQVTNSMTLTVAIEHSGDGRNWAQLNATPEINNASLSTTDTSVYFGYQTLDRSIGLAFFRLRITLDNFLGVAGAAHIKVNVTARDQSQASRDVFRESTGIAAREHAMAMGCDCGRSAEGNSTSTSGLPVSQEMLLSRAGFPFAASMILSDGGLSLSSDVVLSKVAPSLGFGLGPQFAGPGGPGGPGGGVPPSPGLPPDAFLCPVGVTCPEFDDEIACLLDKSTYALSKFGNDKLVAQLSSQIDTVKANRAKACGPFVDPCAALEQQFQQHIQDQIDPLLDEITDLQAQLTVASPAQKGAIGKLINTLNAEVAKIQNQPLSPALSSCIIAHGGQPDLDVNALIASATLTLLGPQGQAIALAGRADFSFKHPFHQKFIITSFLDKISAPVFKISNFGGLVDVSATMTLISGGGTYDPKSGAMSAWLSVRLEYDSSAAPDTIVFHVKADGTGGSAPLSSGPRGIGGGGIAFFVPAFAPGDLFFGGQLHGFSANLSFLAGIGPHPYEI